MLGIFREKKGRSWLRAARTAAARYILGARVWTAGELKSALGPTTAHTYEAWARRTKGVEALTEELPESAKLHWVGPRSVDRVILFFHGAPTNDLHRPVLTTPGRRWRISAPSARRTLRYAVISTEGLQGCSGLCPAQLLCATTTLLFLCN